MIKANSFANSGFSNESSKLGWTLTTGADDILKPIGEDGWTLLNQSAPPKIPIIMILLLLTFKFKGKESLLEQLNQ